MTIKETKNSENKKTIADIYTKPLRANKECESWVQKTAKQSKLCSL
jgi:hypothetical protein